MAIEKVAQLAETIMPIKNIVMKEILPVVNLIVSFRQGRVANIFQGSSPKPTHF
jgi:hypothetical protein